TGISIGVFTYGKDMNWTINNVHGENVTRLITASANSSDISITNVSMDGMSSTLLSVNSGYNIVLDNGYAIDAFTLISLAYAKDIRISNVFARDKVRSVSPSRSGILFSADCENVTVDNVHIQGNYYAMLSFGSDSTGNHTISNSTFIHEHVGNHAINMNNAKDLSLVNNTIVGTIISNIGLGPYYLINNKINGSIDIREATEGMIVGNYGDLMVMKV